MASPLTLEFVWIIEHNFAVDELEHLLGVLVIALLLKELVQLRLDRIENVVI